MNEIKLSKKEIEHILFLLRDRAGSSGWCVKCNWYNGGCKYYNNIQKKLMDCKTKKK